MLVLAKIKSPRHYIDGDAPISTVPSDHVATAGIDNSMFNLSQPGGRGRGGRPPKAQKVKPNNQPNQQLPIADSPNSLLERPGLEGNTPATNLIEASAKVQTVLIVPFTRVGNAEEQATQLASILTTSMERAKKSVKNKNRNNGVAKKDKNRQTVTKH